MGDRYRECKSDNATVWGWSERMQMEARDSLESGQVTEVPGYTSIVSKSNDLQSLTDIWQSWDFKMKQEFQLEYGDIALLLKVRTDKNLLRALTQFWNPGYNCFTFGLVDLTPTIEEYTALLRCPRIKEGKVYMKPKDAPSFLKNLIDLSGMSGVWFQGRITGKGNDSKTDCIAWCHVQELINTHPDGPKRRELFALGIYGLVIFLYQRDPSRQPDALYDRNA